MCTREARGGSKLNRTPRYEFRHSPASAPRHCGGSVSPLLLFCVRPHPHRFPFSFCFARDFFFRNGRLGFGLLHYTITLWYSISRNILLIMKNESAKLGKNMKMIRTAKAISQGDIARSLGVSRGFVSNIENGKTNPTLLTITKLAKVLGVSTDKLLK